MCVFAKRLAHVGVYVAECSSSWLHTYTDANTQRTDWGAAAARCIVYDAISGAMKWVIWWRHGFFY